MTPLNPFDHVAHAQPDPDTCKACAWDAWQAHPPVMRLAPDAYADDPCCPVCWFTGFLCDTPVAQPNGDIHRDVICDLCGARWTEQYALGGYTHLQPPTPLQGV